jgi:hypothetical protein
MLPNSNYLLWALRQLKRRVTMKSQPQWPLDTYYNSSSAAAVICGMAVITVRALDLEMTALQRVLAYHRVSLQILAALD